MEEPKVDKMLDKANPDAELSDKDQMQVDQYIQVLTELLHSPKSRDSVTDTLTASPDPFDSVPLAAMKTNDMGVNLMKQSGVDVHFGIQLAASTFLISDLLHLGYAAAGWEQLDQQEMADIYEDTVQMVIERGLEDGSIDPIQLQLETEPLMTENQRAGGNALGQQGGVPEELQQGAMIEQHTNKKMRQSDSMRAKTDSLKAQKGAKQGMTQQALGGPQ